MDDWAENYVRYLGDDESEKDLAICSNNEVVDGEDALAVIETANKIIMSMQDAFKRRFPEPTQHAINVTFNALLHSLVGFCRNLGPIDAPAAIDHVVDAMMQLEDELESEATDTESTGLETS